VRVAGVHDQYNLVGMELLRIAQRTDQMGEVYGRVTLRGLDPLLSRQRLENQKQIRWALALVLVVEVLRLPGRGGEGLSGFRHQLFAGLVQAHLRSLGIVGAGGALQDILHGIDKLGIGNYPLLLLSWFERIFLRVVRTHSVLMVSTRSNSTSLPANSVRVHRTLPWRTEAS
jgi:hypothetical protein